MEKINVRIPAPLSLLFLFWTLSIKRGFPEPAVDISQGGLREDKKAARQEAAVPPIDSDNHFIRQNDHCWNIFKALTCHYLGREPLSIR